MNKGKNSEVESLDPSTMLTYIRNLVRMAPVDESKHALREQFYQKLLAVFQSEKKVRPPKLEKAKRRRERKIKKKR